MTWTWHYEDADGGAVSGPDDAFTSQADAESWLGQAWREIAAAGAVSVALVEDDRVEYRMGLSPGGQ